MRVFPAFLFACSLTAGSPVLVELFTSQGCNSCPPADRVLAELAQEPDVVVLSEHVDYWNYLGWRDPYSQAQFSERQGEYARRLSRQGVYTPQAIVDGRIEVLGSDERRLRQAIAQAAAAPKVAVSIGEARREGSQVMAGVSGPGALWVAVAEERVAGDVTRGENAGRRLSHAAVVRVLKKVSPGAVTLDLPAGAGRNGWRVVAFAQAPDGRVTGVSQVKLH